MTEQLVEQLGYIGISLILVLGGLGLPIPEEAPILLAAVLSRNGRMWWPFSLSSCLIGVLLGDFVVYFLGFFYGEKVLSLPVTRRLLTRAREAQIKGYFHRHGFKILVLGRFAVGFRTAAYLTAGILKLPPLKLFLTDLLAASISTFLMFGLGYVFAHQIQSGIREAQQWLTVVIGVSVAIWLFYRFYKARQRAGLPVGPPVLVTDDLPLPPDDLVSHPPKLPDESGSLPKAYSPAVAQIQETGHPRAFPEAGAPPLEREAGPESRSQPECHGAAAIDMETQLRQAALEQSH